MSGEQSSTAHGVLDYLISRAVLEGKTGASTLSIPLSDFVQEFEGPKFSDDVDGLVLQVKIITSWDTSELDETIIETIEDEDPEDEDSYGNN
jgi:hypothetical protein